MWPTATLLWGAQNQGTTFTNYASNLSALNITRPTSVEFIDNNGVDALLVGGLSSIANAQSPIAVADSNNGNLTDFRLFGSGLPNALVYQMTYNPLADVLAIATIGRGVFYALRRHQLFSAGACAAVRAGKQRLHARRVLSD